jgi:hypothetical protein
VEEIVIKRKRGKRRRVTTPMKPLFLLENSPPGTQPARRFNSIWKKMKIDGFPKPYYWN